MFGSVLKFSYKKEQRSQYEQEYKLAETESHMAFSVAKKTTGAFALVGAGVYNHSKRDGAAVFSREAWTSSNNARMRVTTAAS